MKLYPPRDPIIGKRFGRLVVVAYVDTPRDSMWLCRCDCGKECTVSRKLLTMGEKGRRSCGCLKGEATRRRYQMQDRGATLQTVWR